MVFVFVCLFDSAFAYMRLLIGYEDRGCWRWRLLC